MNQDLWKRSEVVLCKFGQIKSPDIQRITGQVIENLHYKYLGDNVLCGWRVSTENMSGAIQVKLISKWIERRRFAVRKDKGEFVLLGGQATNLRHRGRWRSRRPIRGHYTPPSPVLPITTTLPTTLPNKARARYCWHCNFIRALMPFEPGAELSRASIPIHHCLPFAFGQSLCNVQWAVCNGQCTMANEQERSATRGNS